MNEYMNECALRNGDRLLSIKEAASILGVSRATVYKIIASDPDLRTIKVRRQRRVRVSDLEVWLQLKQASFDHG